MIDAVSSRCLIAIAALTIVARASTAGAQSPASSTRKFEIVDNSFLVEESFNQEAGVFQNIFMWVRSREGDWQASFTQEWPLGGTAHQLSYTVPFGVSSAGNSAHAAGFGDLYVNYRYQLWAETLSRPAVSPRLSLVAPTPHEASGIGGGTFGLQLNVPASKQFGDVYVHANAGGVWRHQAGWTSQIAGSGIWRITPMWHLMLESFVEFDRTVIVSPGVRRGWNIGDRQIVIGAALPTARGDRRTTTALLTYFSYELPFK